MSDQKIRVPFINKIIISGRLTNQPETKFTQSGTQITTFRIASDTPRKNKDGEWDRETLFIKVVTFGYLAEKVQGQVKKGTPLIVEGRLRMNEFTPSDGERKVYFEINADRVHPLVWLGSAQFDTSSDEVKDEEVENDIDDDIPF